MLYLILRHLQSSHIKVSGAQEPKPGKAPMVNGPLLEHPALHQPGA